MKWIAWSCLAPRAGMYVWIVVLSLCGTTLPARPLPSSQPIRHTLPVVAGQRAGPRGGGGTGAAGGYPIASNPPVGALVPYSAQQNPSGGSGYAAPANSGYIANTGYTSSGYNSAGSGYTGSNAGGGGSYNNGYGSSGSGGSSNCGGADGLGGLGGAGGVSSLIAGLDINLLDVKLIGLGYVRPQLVDSLCQRATNTLIVEGEKRARCEVQNLLQTLIGRIDKRCADLVNEGERVCGDVIGMAVDRYNTLIAEALKEVDTQCKNVKATVVDRTKQGVNQTFQMVQEVSLRLAEESYRRTVEEMKNKGERQFQEMVEAGREQGEAELSRRVQEGRDLAEQNFTTTVEIETAKAEDIFKTRLAEGRKLGEEMFVAQVAKERSKADELFNRELEKGKKEAQAMFDAAVAKGKKEGEKMCSEMILVACKNVTENTASSDFCQEFCFFSGVCKEGSAFDSKNANIVRQRFGPRNKAERLRLQALTANATTAADKADTVTEKASNATAEKAAKANATDVDAAPRAGNRRDKSKEPEMDRTATEPTSPLTSAELEDLGDASVEAVTQKEKAKKTTTETAVAERKKEQKIAKGNEDEDGKEEEKEKEKEDEEEEEKEKADKKARKKQDQTSKKTAAPERTYLRPKEDTTVRSVATTAAAAKATTPKKSSDKDSNSDKSNRDSGSESNTGSKNVVTTPPPNQRAVIEKQVEDVVDLRNGDFGEKLSRRPTADSSSTSPSSDAEPPRRFYRYSSYYNSG